MERSQRSEGWVSPQPINPKLMEAHMRHTLKALPICAVAAITSGMAIGQTMHAVRSLNGYACMSLNLTDAQMSDRNLVIPVYANPSMSEPIGQASAVVIAPTPPRRSNGFIQVLLFSNQPGWVEAKYVKPWQNPGPSGQQCIPSVMSNGSAGFSFR